MCFIAIEIDNDVFFLDDKSNLSYNELHDAFETLYDEYKKLSSKYNLLKKKPCMFTCWEKYIRKKNMLCNWRLR